MPVKEEEKKLKIIVLRPTFIKGVPLEVGKTKTLPKKDALDLIAANKARELDKITDQEKAEMELLEARLKMGKDAKKEMPPAQIARVPDTNTGREITPIKAKSKNQGKDAAEAKELEEKKAAQSKAKADEEAAKNNES